MVQGSGSCGRDKSSGLTVSPATAAAIVEAYPSPSLLLQVSPHTPLCPVKSLEDEGREGCHVPPRLKVFVDAANNP